ncbi:MAG: PQQ-binding-like beta-propeller repeat protein [Anaerolineae bacterium]
MTEHRRDSNPEAVPERSHGRSRRGIAGSERGLSRRLLQPPDSHDPDAGKAVSETAEASFDGPAAAQETSRGEGPRGVGRPSVGEASLETRVVSGKAKAKIGEGLLPEGTQLQGRYKILGVIGVGGMGAVYKAQDLRFPGVMRLCAVKEMINTATDPQVREMIVRNFEREASILATLSHPAIPQVYDYFTEGSRSYLVIEFIHGEDLEARVSQIEGFFPEAHVVDWAVQLCEVLSYLHNHKPRPIIFRDLKPSNIMLDNHGRIRLIDFGIAKLFQSGEKGTMIGTEGYSPPEQYRGVAEPRGDIYALGATMHHLLSKQDPRLEPPFSFQERPIHLSNPTVSKELLLIIDKALEYDLNQRWGSPEELRRALLSLASARGLMGGRGDTTAMLGSGTVKPIWRFACEDEVRGSVTITDKLVLAPSYDHNVYALDIEEGKFVWKYAAEGGIASSPCVCDDLAVFGSTDRMIYGVDVKTGDGLWTMPTKGRVFSTAYPKFGHVFIGSDDGDLYAIQAQSGRKAWAYAADGEIRSRPFVTDDLIVFSCNLGLVYALTLSRELRWRFRARRGILSSPVIHTDLVLIGSLDWHFYALDRRSGWVVWKQRTGGPIASTAAVWDDLIIFGSADGYIYALEGHAGRLVWRLETDGQVTGSATVYDGAVYIGGVDGGLYCIDAQSGNVRWRYQTEGAITGAPQAADGVVYFGSSDHYVYALPA